MCPGGEGLAETGTATYYGASDDPHGDKLENGSGACWKARSYGVCYGKCFEKVEGPRLLAAINTPEMGLTSKIGSCYKVKCKRGAKRGQGSSQYGWDYPCRTEEPIEVMITDSCPCHQNEHNKRNCCGPAVHLDLSYWAFEKIADPKWGLVDVEAWEVACSDSSGSKYGTEIKDCCGWRSTHTRGVLRVTRKGWRLRAHLPDNTPSLNDLDLLTRDLTGATNQRMLELVPDFSRCVLLVSMHCMALPQALVSMLWRVERIVAVDVSPYLQHVARKYFWLPKSVRFVQDRSLEAYLRARHAMVRFDCIVLDGGAVPSRAALNAAGSALERPGGRLVVRVGAHDLKQAVRAVAGCGSLFAHVQAEAVGQSALVWAQAGRLSQASPSNTLMYCSASFA
ncbi:hypothetical protein OEZ85_002357 [Tetradesmus obliquus]|uniref:Expansin-like EG45 domain-containing protein n=1 Tax=Tetradesmus obliquus TaxID=3088 RepID=A0ABY8U2R1_TETOB|nr:hypothetical protein OEZ85_002357 [Tetradesmus obliquus]